MFTVNLCPPLSDINNGQLVMTGFLEGNLAIYSCEEGYELQDGAIQRQCQSTNNVGFWSGNEPRCGEHVWSRSQTQLVTP